MIPACSAPCHPVLRGSFAIPFANSIYRTDVRFGGIDALEVAERIEMHGAGVGGIDPTGAQLRRCQGPRPLGGATSSFTATAGRIRGAAWTLGGGSPAAA